MPPSVGDGGRWRIGGFTLAFAACLATIVLVAPSARSASPPVVGAEATFVAQVNAMRAQRGLPALTVDDELTGIARQWAATMADGAGLTHNPDLKSEVTADWNRLSENVGYGEDADHIMADFENSPIHVSNMVDPAVTRIGVGVVRDSRGYLWTAHDFMGVQSTDAGPAPAPAAIPKPRARATKAAARPVPSTVAAPAPTVPVELAPPTTVAAVTPSSATGHLPDNVALSSVTTAPATHGTAIATMFFAVAAGFLVAVAVVRIRRSGLI